MINAKELMIGNLFIDELTNNILQVSALSFDKVEFTVLNRSDFPLPNGWAAKPIPITEDWLVNKYGFIIIHENEAGKRYGYIIDGVVNSDLCFTFWETTTEAGKFFRHGLEIKYVHQLQNLYFALTQTELELK